MHLLNAVESIMLVIKLDYQYLAKATQDWNNLINKN